MRAPALRRLFSIRGRADRVEFFLGQLVLSGAFVGLSLFKQILAGGGRNPAWFAAPVIAVWLWCAVCLGARRCHDFDYRGYWLLLCLIPIVNFFAGLALLLVPGSVGLNRFDAHQEPEPA